MYILYTIEAILILGMVSLIIGVLWKIISYPQKVVRLYGISKTGVRTCWVGIVDDNDYHYKKSELVEPYTVKWEKNEVTTQVAK